MRLYSISLLLFIVLVVPAGCQKAYYATWEKLGKEKRHLLKDQVKKGEADQKKASEQFENVLEQIKAMYGLDGGDLEKFYKKLKSDFEDCEDRAENVRKRADKVEQVATALFIEWEKEINEITSQKLKNNSRKSLSDAKKRYAILQRAMLKAEASMTPVLKTLKDYVLYLKHNLNARAISSLKQEVGDIEIEITSLIKDMNLSIKASREFIKNIDSDG